MFDDILDTKKQTKTVEVKNTYDTPGPMVWYYDSYGYKHKSSMKFLYPIEEEEKYERVPENTLVPKTEMVLVPREEYEADQSYLIKIKDIIRKLYKENGSLKPGWHHSTLLGQDEKRYDTNDIKDARKTIHDAFVADPDFLRVYVDNIAMLLADEEDLSEQGFLDFRDKSVRNHIAMKIMSLIFT